MLGLNRECVLGIPALARRAHGEEDAEMTEQQPTTSSGLEPVRMSSHYNPVKVIDTVGSVFLGLIALILLVALLRAQARNRALQAELLEKRG